MSNTTVINSKAMQAAVAQAEQRPGVPPKGPTFHQMLEGALGEKDPTAAKPAGLAKSEPATESTPSELAAKLAAKVAKEILATAPSRKLDVVKQLANSATTPISAQVAANDDPDATPAAAKATPGSDAGAVATDAAKLDVTQLKVVNAPAIPEVPTAVARASAQPTTARQLSGGARATAAAGSQSTGQLPGPVTAGASSPRGFSAALASAHVGNVLPASLVDQASFDPSLHLSITPQAARLSMDTGPSGPLMAQLQITNGIADVRLTGDAASLLVRHGAELSLGLTAAGLQPGRVEISAPTAGADLQSATSDGSSAFRSDAQARDGSETQQRNQPQAPQLTDHPSVTTSSTVVGRASRLHIKA